MFSATKILLSYPVFVATLCAGSSALRICADPNALPYSNQPEQGFENELGRMIAHDLHMSVSYTWLAQREAFFDKTLNAGLCDVVMGVPVGMSGVATTRPYYRSGYVFVSRRDRNLDIHSLDDPRLQALRIGVNTLGDNDGEVPPVHALVTRGIVRNLVSYNIFGALEEANPAATLITAVARGDVDLAVAWGPIAGYFARDSGEALHVAPIDDDPQNPALPFGFDIGIGVRTGDRALKQLLDAELAKRRREIDHLLQRYGIPQMAAPTVARERHH
jgi:quinoprotein dehydrogenase-associated probable ABC transporter substrate-binding protein